MTKTRGFLFTASLVLATAFTFSCSSDDGDSGCNVEGGKLKGCAWERKLENKSSVASWDLTYTLDFTSDEKVTLIQKGWEETNTITGGKQKRNVNETDDYTYVYVHDIREGGARKTPTSTPVLFTISADYKTLRWSSNNYKRK